jgi:hypothetical protein
MSTRPRLVTRGSGQHPAPAPAATAAVAVAMASVRAATAAPGPVVGSVCTGYGGLDLGVLAALGGGRIAWCADPVLRRLLEPINEVTGHSGHWGEKNVARVCNSVLGRVHKEQRPYWRWDEATWIDLAEQAGVSRDRAQRAPVVAVAHLLGLHRSLHHHVQVQESRVAELVFGRHAFRQCWPR